MRDLAKGRARRARSRSRSVCRAEARAAGGAEERQAGEDAGEAACALNFCCSPKGCRHDSGREVRDMESAVKVVCSDKACKEGVFMHETCFLSWEDDIVKNLQSHYRQAPGRLHTWTAQQVRRDLWNKRVYDIAYKICLCRCGGFLKKDADWAAEREAEKLRNLDEAAEKKKKKKKGDKPVLGTDHGPTKKGKRTCPKFTLEKVSPRQLRRTARRKYITGTVVAPKVDVIPNPSQGATGGDGGRSREWSPKVIPPYSYNDTEPSVSHPVTTSASNIGNGQSPSYATVSPSNNTAIPSNRPSPGNGNHDDIPRSLLLMATYWWSNFGWRTYLDHALYASETVVVGTRTQGLVTCKSVQDVEAALCCHDNKAVSEMLGEWWQEVGWDQFKCFLGQQ